MESHLYRRALLDCAIFKAKWENTISPNGLKYIDRIKEICRESAMVSRDKSRVYRYLQHLVHVIENERYWQDSLYMDFLFHNRVRKVIDDFEAQGLLQTTRQLQAKLDNKIIEWRPK